MRITLEDAEKQKETEQADQSEREKISSLHGTKRLEYLWDYYKWVLGVLILVIILASVVISSVRNASAKELFYVMAIDQGTADTQKLSDDLKQVFEPGKSRDYVTADNSCFTDSTGKLDYNSSMVFSVKVTASQVDVLLMPESIYDTYNKDGMFLPIADVMGEDYCKAHQDSVSGNQITIRANSYLEGYGFSFQEPMVLAVLASSSHTKTAAQWIQMLQIE